MCGFVCELERRHGDGGRRPPVCKNAGEPRAAGAGRVRLPSCDGIRLGHTRLSIIDLVTGDQPHFNEDKTLACVLNGEIYNYRALRRQLQQKGHDLHL